MNLNYWNIFKNKNVDKVMLSAQNVMHMCQKILPQSKY